MYLQEEPLNAKNFEGKKQQATSEDLTDDGLTTCAVDNLQLSDATTNMNDSST